MVSLERICDYMGLTVTTLVFILVCIANGLANSSIAMEVGIIVNTTPEVSNQFLTQVTPASYAFIIWGVVYAWQGLWLVYAWSFTCRPSAQRTIYPAVYVCYSIANCFNIAWIFTWGNLYLTATIFLIIPLNIALYSTIGFLFGYFNHIQDQVSKWDVWLTRAIVMNGLCFYSAWTTVTICTNLTSVLQYHTSLSAPDSASLTLTLFIGFVLAYFLLENTVLDHYGFRYVVSVYPVALWALSTIIVEHWNEEGAERSAGYTLSLLILTAVLLMVRILLVAGLCSYHFFKRYSQGRISDTE